MRYTKFLLCNECDFILGKIGYNYKLTKNDFTVPYLMCEFQTPQEHVCYCKNCKQFTTHYEVDEDIINIVAFLHNVGFKTKFSCSGHTYVNEIMNKDENYFFNYSRPYLCIIKDEKAINEILPKIKDKNTYKNINVITDYIEGFEYTRDTISFELNQEYIDEITDNLNLKYKSHCKDAKKKLDLLFQEFNTNLYHLLTSIIEDGDIY